MKVFTEVKETQITNKTETKKYMSYDGKLFGDEKSCRDYESALTKVNVIALTTSNDCKIVNEFDMYSTCAGSEEYYYLVATVTESTKAPLEMVYNAFHCNDEVARLEFKKRLNEGERIVFDVGYLGYCVDVDISNEVIDTLDDFSFSGTVEEFKKSRLEGFSLLD